MRFTDRLASRRRALAIPPKLSFVGGDTCASCHGGEVKLWHGSQHAHAMAHATKDTVLGDFNDASFDYFGVHSRFFRDGDKFMVETDGPNGKLAAFEVKYTFGLDPLQQYLVEFPDGRIQALSLSWIRARRTKAASAGSISIRMKRSATTTSCIGPSSIRIGTSCAPSATRPACTRTTTRRRTASPRGGPKSASAAKRATARARRTSPGRRIRKAGGLTRARTPTGPLVRFDERSGVTWGRDAKTGFPVRSASPAGVRKEVDRAGYATRVGDWSPKIGCPDGRFPTRISSLRSPRALPARRSDAR